MQSKLWNSYFASSASKALDAISQAVRCDITRYLLGLPPIPRNLVSLGAMNTKTVIFNRVAHLLYRCSRGLGAEPTNKFEASMIIEALLAKDD